jgi:DNA mismatch repair protein MutS2
MESADRSGPRPPPETQPPQEAGEKTLRLLEFDTIRSRTAECARSGEAAELLLKEPPLWDPVRLEALKILVGEMAACIGSAAGEPRGSFPDTAPILAKLAVEGTCLTLEEAYALGIFIELAEDLRRWILRPEREAASLKKENAPLIKEAAALPGCGAASREIFRVVDKGGRLRELPEFKAIQRRIQSLSKELENAVSRYTTGEETRRMLQSGLPSQRDGRVVLALKANYRGRIKGIVHEVSATGQTLFIEPEEVVEKNNGLLIERRRLDAEIHRVLRGMTAALAGGREDLEELRRKVLALEMIRAKARYSYETKGCFALCPHAVSGESAGPAGAGLILKGARHPLMGAGAVPIDLAMQVKTVIITGPNTGGKTVALKTAGLFALMNQWGLALPAEEAVLPVFDGIYADIGDEQSLSQSLSTFSAHMTNIAAITERATAQSLVLLDELGSGTDPEEGSAIAMAVLDHLTGKGVRLIVTTHHGILKNYGYTREGVENASVEFDGRTLSPTYRIVMGVPGESRAVDIAGRNGLDPSIVAAARSYLEEERSDVSTLIRGLKQKHRELDSAAAEQQQEETRLREERRRADLKELRLRQKELDLKNAGIGSLQRLLSESRKTLENLVREVKEGELSREKTLKVKEFLKDLAGSAAVENEALEAESRVLAEERRRLEQPVEAEYGSTFGGNAEGSAAAQSDGESPGGRSGTGLAIEPGAEVLAGEFRRRGRVIRADRKSRKESPALRYWIVEIGSLKMSFPETELVPVRPLPGTKPLIAAADLAQTPQALFELSLRGMRLEEALEALERQIDAAALAGLHAFSVIHGKGDGILQRGVHEYLKTQPMVADYYFSRPELGGFGRTEVALKEQ